MGSIDIVTAHKVEINYPLASVGQRIIAFVLDAIIIMIGISLLAYLFFDILAIGSSFSQYGEIVGMLIIAPFYVFYTLVSEALMNGQTLGKKALGIRVVKLNGENLKFSDYATRWVFRLIDIWTCSGSLAIIFISSNKKNQRIGDILANTCVIRTTSFKKIDLEDVLGIMNMKDYKVTFEKVDLFNEQEMLLVKETLERYKRHHNNAHKKALHLLSQKMSEKLRLEKAVVNDEKFLKTLLRDYIYRTR